MKLKQLGCRLQKCSNSVHERHDAAGCSNPEHMMQVINREAQRSCVSRSFQISKKPWDQLQVENVHRSGLRELWRYQESGLPSLVL